jgi:hypothetical protein
VVWKCLEYPWLSMNMWILSNRIFYEFFRICPNVRNDICSNSSPDLQQNKAALTGFGSVNPASGLVRTHCRRDDSPPDGQ